MMYCPNCKMVKADNGLDSCDDCLELKRRKINAKARNN